MKNTKPSINIFAIFILVAAAVIWGASFVVVKDSLDYVTPLWQLAIRLGVASAVGLIILPSQLKYINKKILFQGVVLGIIFACAVMPQNLGAQLTTAGKCAFLTVSYVAFTPVIELIALKKGLTIQKTAAVVICIIGIAFITLNERLALQTGDILLLITGFFYGVHLVWIDGCDRGRGILAIHILQIFTSTAIALAAALIFEPFKVCINRNFILAMLYGGIFEVFVGFLLQIKGQQGTNPSLAGILLSMECVYAAIFGIIFQGDKMAGKMLVGCALVFASAVIAAVEPELPVGKHGTAALRKNVKQQKR